jgi:hypothetical protein
MSNVIVLDEVRARRALAGRRRAGERRDGPRRRATERMFVQIVRCESRPELVGTTLSCTASDLSADGIRFATARPVPRGALLDLWVDLPSRPGKFFLAGEVRWSRPDGTTTHVGVRLRQGAATDYVEWRELQLQSRAQ